MAAIYMWPVDNQVILTTTLYPVDATDYLQVNISVIGGEILEIPLSDIKTTHGMLDGIYEQVIWRYEDGPYDSDINTNLGALDSVYEQVIWRYEDGPYDSSITTNLGMFDGTFVNKRIRADSPDENLGLEIAILATSTMDII